MRPQSVSYFWAWLSLLLGTKKAVALQRSLVAVCFAISLIALCGYLYGVHSLYSVPAYSTVAVHTAAGFLAACLAYFFAQPYQGIVSIAASETNSGLLLRTVVPAIIVVPIVIGLLRVAGQKAGLYDTWFGVALQVLGSVVCLTALTLVVARSMNRMEWERSRAEQAQLRCTAIVESSEDAIAALDTNGIITHWNKGAERLFGYSASEAIGKNILFLSEAYGRDDAKGVLKKVWQGETVKQHETVRRRKDGSSVDIALTVSPMVDSQGRIVGASGIARDITERKLAEQDLATASERLHLAIESGSVGGWDYNLKTGKKVWFGETHAQLGMAPHEPPGSFEESWDRIHKDDREHLQHALRVARDKHEQFTEEFRVVWRDGTTRWVRSRGRFFYAPNGEPERLLGLSVDITESKQAEQALREMNRVLDEQSAALRSQEELLKIFVKNVPAAVIMLDRNMRYLQVSDRWCADLSVDSSQVVGRSHYEIFPDLPDRWKQGHRRALEGETLRVEEDRWDREEGTIWCRWEVRPWKNLDGSTGGILIFSEDITRRKQMEEALSDLSRKLIESQEQERARIGRELHDDINQRLAILSLELEQLRENPSEIQPRVKELRRQMAEVSNDVQALSHDLHSSKLEYLGVVAGMKSWCKEFAERQKLEIEFRSDASSILPLAVGISLFRVLQEALNNAIKHSGVKRIEIQLREESGEIHLIVSD
ncbi:MAG TPA: PAS domain S-box protein, partial [Candidatus Cybelea sp.]|nr:PAS domain S-box protein [Candidatus Cybelea sp.]